jgi:MSHA biogenesis protein MshK
MDEAVNLTRIVRPAACALAALALSGAGAAHAQALQDPTRPPAPGIAGAAAGPAAAPQLQSVLVGRAPGGRRIAVIDGETVRQGASFRGARVARVTETEVELVRGRERTVLHLYPQDGATFAAAAAPVAPRP